MAFNPSLLVLAILAIGVSGWGAPKHLKWWQTAIVYQIYPRSFMDSDGDGVGDLAGIRTKLPYLKELGVGAIWISPIYPSPQVDFGYDISNFVGIDSIYGSMEDFDNMVEEAHTLGLKVIMDLVPNHTSDQHPWFIASEDPNHPEHEKYKNYYKWHPGRVGPDGKKEEPNNWRSVFRGSAWAYNEKRGLYYFHHFHKTQPDLDLRNREVVEEMKNVFRFWMDHKVDGFRLDAVPFLFQDLELKDSPLSGHTDDKDDPAYLYEKGHTQHLDEVYELIAELNDVVHNHDDTVRVLMTEGYAGLEDIMKYYGTKERQVSSFPFNFFIMMDTNRYSDAKQYTKVINEWMDYMNDYRWPNWVLGNHDKKRVASRYRPELADALNMLILTLPGTAVTYYGEELGMVDTFISWEDTLDPQAINKGKEGYYEASRDPGRTPMQWDDTTSAGFSTNPRTWLPVNPNYRELNVKNQRATRSHYSIYRQIAEARKTSTLQRGDVKVYDNQGLLIVERTLKDQPSFILVVNFANRRTTWSHPDLHKMMVYASSLNSGLEDGQNMRTSLKIKPYAAVLLHGGGPSWRLTKSQGKRKPVAAKIAASSELKKEAPSIMLET